MIRRTVVAALLGLVMAGTAAAQDAAPTDPQIAHIAYTAGQIDVPLGGEHPRLRHTLVSLDREGGAGLHHSLNWLLPSSLQRRLFTSARQ